MSLFQYSRRTALKTIGAALLLPGMPVSPARTEESQADAVIIGGGMGACAAALGLCRNGMRVIMTEETDWIGGQVTAQAVPPDEHPWIESFGATRAYRDFRTRIRDYYRRHYPLTGEAHRTWNFNPGNAWVSRISHEPKVSLAVLRALLAPYLSAKKLTILKNHRAVRADADGDVVRSVTVRNIHDAKEITLYGAYFIDATECGDLLPLTGAEYVTGFESRAETGEPHAPEAAQPANMQAFTQCFAMDHREGENHVIDKPDIYGYWREYVPRLRPPWSGRLLSWQYSNPRTLEPRTLSFIPGNKDGWWGYRRIIDKTNFLPGSFDSDVTIVNWPQNDYLDGSIIDVSGEERAAHLYRSRQLSLSLLYWIQTEAPRPDGGAGYPGIRLRPDVTDTADGIAKYPYIRESRRIRAEFTVCEQHVGVDARMTMTGKPREELGAEIFRDSIGVGYYSIDLHPSTGGDNYIDISSFPFQIPLGALIHRRMENLIPACKNIGTTHITNGCYRLHPVEWNIGESAGTLAAYCVSKKLRPRQVRNTPGRLEEFQTILQEQGVEIRWPRM